MKVEIYSRERAASALQKGNFPENTAVLSFYDPVNPRTGEIDKPVDYSQKTNRVFSVSIHDIDLEVLPDFGMTYDTYFPEAESVAKFIYAAYHDGLDIVCQCEYGQSRSAACAAAILEHFYHNGITIFSDYRYYPNQVVFHKVYDALESISENAIPQNIIRTNRGKGLIGIWWYTDSGEVWAAAAPANSGIIDGMYVQYSDVENHLTLWSRIVKENTSKSEADRIISKGYKSLERGRVIYNTATMCYEITCSNNLIYDKAFRQGIIDHFQLAESQFEFVCLDHYQKTELSGNPALDAFIENN